MDYESSVEEVNTVTKRIKVSIPATLVASEVQSALADYAKNAAVKGFRPGKAPLQMVEQLHGSRVRMEVANRLISTTLGSAIEKHEISDVVGSPEIDLASYEAEKDINYTAELAIYPRPTIKDYKKVKVTVSKREVDENEIAASIEALRDGKATLKKVEFRETVQEKDVIQGEVKTALEGEPAPERPEPLTIGLGEGRLPEDVEKALIGARLNEEKVVLSKIADNHPRQELRGKSVTYTILIQGLFEKVLPEVDDAFAKSLELGVETLLELRLKIREMLEANKKQEQQADIQAAILSELLKTNLFQVPQIMVDDELRSILVRQGLLDPKKVDVFTLSMEPFREKLGEAAERRVRISIAVSQIARQENIQASDQDIEAAITEMANQHSLPREEVRKFFTSSERASGFREEITGNKVLDFLVKEAVVEFSGQAGS